MSEQNGKPSGGIGGELFANDRHILSDLNISRRAIRNGWNVKPELKQKILDRMALIVEAEADDDIAIKASKIVLEADKIDVMTERNERESSPKGNGNVSVNVNIVEQVVVKPTKQETPVIAEQVIEKPSNGRNGHA